MAGRALPPGGTLVTLELDAKHAEVARRSLDGAAPGVGVEVRVGDAVASLRQMIESGEEPFDVVFIDADKPRYVEDLELSLQLCRPGSIILGDNLIRHGLVLDAATTDANARGARAFNQAIASHPRLESLVLPIIREQGRRPLDFPRAVARRRHLVARQRRADGPVEDGNGRRRRTAGSPPASARRWQLRDRRLDLRGSARRFRPRDNHLVAVHGKPRVYRSRGWRSARTPP